MKNKIRTSSVSRGIFQSVFAQLVSVSVSLIFSLLVPKFIPELEYAHWQAFVLYIAYVGLFHFGLMDGLILRYSQYDLEEINRPLVRSQYRILFFFTLAIGTAGTVFSLLFLTGWLRSLLILLSIGTVTKNLFTYTSYTFQITNRIANYAFLIIIQRVVNGVGVIVLLLLGVKDFTLYCAAELAGDLIGSFVASISNRGFYFGKIPAIREVFREVGINLSAGVKLLIANWSSIFLIGSAKMVVNWHWDDLLFGKVSFAFSVSNLFLTFVSAVGVVLFPSIKRMEQDRLPSVYRDVRGILSPFLSGILIFYFPGCWFLKMWLPNYSESLFFLGILLPVIVYSSRVTLLTDNYLKAYRKESLMLGINLSCIALALGAFLMSAYLFDNLTSLLVSVVILIAIRSILSELAVYKVAHIGSHVWDFVFETVQTVGFILIARYFGLLLGTGLYAILLIPSFVYHRRDFAKLFEGFKQRFSKQSAA